MRLLRFSPLLILWLLFASGCARKSPLVGTWTGAVKVGQSAQSANPLSMAAGMLGTLLNGPCTLQLNGDGKGFIKVASLPERPIAWSEQGGKIILRADEPPPANASGTNAQNNSIVGTLSPDQQTMTLDFGIANAQLEKGAS